MDREAIRTAQLSASLWADFQTVFGPSDGCDGCWCFNHRIAPGQPDVSGAEARDAMRQLVAQDDVGGILAYLDDRPAGWCAVDQRSKVPGHDCVDSASPNIWTILCFLVPRAFRGKGIAKVLLRAAIAQIESKGGTVVESYARPPEQGAAAFDFLPDLGLFEDWEFVRVNSLDQNYCRLQLSL